ncbi:MAG: hypothetical protein E7J78_17945, partial [Pantoea sp.]|nr:hypothetical protein [Pantoea sp.]
MSSILLDKEKEGVAMPLPDFHRSEPFTLGISAAAAFGGASSIVLKWQLIAQPQFNLALVAWLAA